MPRERSYTRNRIDGLIEGWYWGPDGHSHDALHWADLRAVLEHHGQLEQEGVLLVMDLERAMAALASSHPDAAAVVSFRCFLDSDDERMDAAFGNRRGTHWERLLRKGKAWIEAFLNEDVSGDDRRERIEAAYRRAK